VSGPTRNNVCYCCGRAFDPVIVSAVVKGTAKVSSGASRGSHSVNLGTAASLPPIRHLAAT
jgi:hypothetical protein